MNMKTILLFSIVLEMIFPGSAAPPMTDPNHEWKSEEVTKVMTLMMKYGEDQAEKKNKEMQEAGCRKDCVVNQYLVVVVLSEAEMSESRNWGNDLPGTITKDSARVRVIFNDNDYKDFPYKTKKPLHGEVLLLHEQQNLPMMVKRLQEETKDLNHYFVVLYSHYIPCSDVKGVQYSCAEEVANAAIVNHGKYTMLVGFKDSFSGTNKEKSEEFMSMGGVKQFQFENKVFVPIKSEVSSKIKTQRIFQSLFYTCLDLSPVSDQCCTVDTSKSNHQQTKEMILSMYVNSVMYYCTTEKLKTFVGKLTELSRFALVNCISEYADGHTSSDCPYCAAPTTIYTIKVCALFATGFGSEVGRPENPNEPYSPKWKQGPATWNSLYDGYNINAEENRPAVFCLKKTNDIKTLCTKTQIKEPVPDLVRSQIQQLTQRLKEQLNQGKQKKN